MLRLCASRLGVLGVASRARPFSSQSGGPIVSHVQRQPDASKATEQHNDSVKHQQVPLKTLDAIGAIGDDEDIGKCAPTIASLAPWAREADSVPPVLGLCLYCYLDTEEEDREEMFVLGPDGTREWGGPTRGGKMPEPTRFGDWERKGRCSDF